MDALLVPWIVHFNLPSMHSGHNEPATHDDNGETAPVATYTLFDKGSVIKSKRDKVSGAAVSAATKLLPLVQLLDTIQPHLTNESVFHVRRLKINAQLAVAYEQLKGERPKRKVLAHAFQIMGELVLEETRDISKDEVKQAAKEFVLATIKNAPAILSAAHQARLLS